MSEDDYKFFRDIQLAVQVENAQERFAENGLAGLANIIREGNQLDNVELRKYIADAMEGKITRPRGKPSLYYRDWSIYQDIVDLLNQGIPLRSNTTQDGAGCLVGQYFDIDEEAVIKAYQRKKKSIEKLSMSIEDLPDSPKVNYE